MKPIFPDAASWTFYHGEGCNQCRNRGYKGRRAIYEFLEVTPQIREMVHNETDDLTLRKAAIEGGTLPAVLNASNEVAVTRFLNKEISFPGIWNTVSQVMEQHDHVANPDLNDVVEADAWARRLATEVKNG